MKELSENIENRNVSAENDVKFSHGLTKDDILEEKILLSKKHVDETFAHFGHKLYTPLVIDRWGRYSTENVNLRYWKHNDQYKKLLNSSNTFYPFEEVEAQIEKISDKLAQERGIHIRQYGSPTYSHNEYSKYWTILSDKFVDVDSNDKIQAGATIRNGIGTSVALGADLYTFREICSNGASVKAKEFGSISITHAIKDTNRITELFTEGLTAIFDKVSEIVEYDRRAKQKKLTQELAEKIYVRTRIADKYYPQYITIDKQKKTNDEGKEYTETKIGLTKEGQTLTCTIHSMI